MDNKAFGELLAENLSLPFEIADVKDVEQNGDSTYIYLKDGKTFIITAEEL